MTWAPSYASTTDLAAYLRISDGDDDPQLSLAIAAASRAIDAECRRQFGLLDPPAARVYSARPDEGGWVVDLDDLSAAVGVIVTADLAGDGGFATTVTGWSLGPVNAESYGRPYVRLFSRTALPVIRNGVRVIGRWGWAAVPQEVAQACLLQAARIHARRNSPFGISGSPENGGELRLLSKVDPDVAVLLRGVTQRWWAV